MEGLKVDAIPVFTFQNSGHSHEKDTSVFLLPRGLEVRKKEVNDVHVYSDLLFGALYLEYLGVR